jgi:hypothetical protein
MILESTPGVPARARILRVVEGVSYLAGRLERVPSLKSKIKTPLLSIYQLNLSLIIFPSNNFEFSVFFERFVTKNYKQNLNFEPETFFRVCSQPVVLGLSSSYGSRGPIYFL